MRIATICTTLGASLIFGAALAAPPAVPGTPVPLIAGEAWCCETETGRWYRPPAVPDMSMRPEVCLALTTGVPAPQGTPEAIACAGDPKQPKDPGPPPTHPVEITTTVENNLVTSWLIDCEGKVFDIMKIPAGVWSDANIDRFDKLVGDFEAANGVAITVEYEMEADPGKPGKMRIKKDARGKKIAKRTRSRCVGPPRGPNGGKALCDFLRGLQ